MVTSAAIVTGEETELDTTLDELRGQFHAGEAEAIEASTVAWVLEAFTVKLNA